MRRGRLVRKSEVMERLVKPVSATITGKDSARSVAAMGCRRQPQHIQARRRIAESRNRSSPVGPLSILSSLFLGNGLPIGHQTRAGSARDDVLIENAERSHGAEV